MCLLFTTSRSQIYSLNLFKMNTSNRPFVIFLILQIYLCVAGCPDLFGQYHFDSWTTDDGLPQNGVRAITQTPDGYLWFTTFDGLVRFDGIRFTTFSKGNTKGIINNRFTSLYSDKDGTLYAATTEDGVLTVYRNGIFTSIDSEQIPGNFIQKIKPDENGKVRFLIQDANRKSDSWYFLREGKFILSEKISKTNVKIKYLGKSGNLWTLEPSKITESRAGEKIIYDYQIIRTENLKF